MPIYYHSDYGGGDSDTGRIVQVVTLSKTDQDSYSMSHQTLTGTISNFSPSITMHDANNKVLVLGMINVDTSSGNYYNAIGVLLYRNGSQIGQGDSAGSRRRIHSSVATAAGYYNSNRGASAGNIHFLDSPGSGTHTYSIQLSNNYSANNTIYVNEGGSQSDHVTRTRTVSTFTLMEIAA